MQDTERFNIHDHVTRQIVAAIEAGAGDWTMPWRRDAGALHRPQNIASGNRYQGVNIISLWITAEARGYAAPLWGTYRQWQEKGAQVRKGERGTPIVFYKTTEADSSDAGAETETAQRRMIARASWVFNAAQVDGYAPPVVEPVSAAPVSPVAAAEALIAATGADIREGGERAYYSPKDDYIAVPDRTRFTGSETSTPTDAWYATHLHELTHWTGAPSRLARELSTRFGSDAYAMEELIAELGSAFLCADLGLAAAPRPDHAAYVASWLKVLKGDAKAIFTAASQADRAARFLMEMAPPPTPPRPDGDGVASRPATLRR